MSDILFPISGGGGGNLDEITASAEHVKSPYTFMNSVIRQIKRCLFCQIKTGLSEHLTMV